MKKFFNQGVSSPLAIGIIAVLAILVVGGVLAYQYYYLPNQEVNNPVIEDVQSETANWETYINNNLGILIKYPPNWTYQEYSCNIDGVAFCPQKNGITGCGLTCSIDNPSVPISFVFDMWNNSKDKQKSFSSSDTRYKDIFDKMVSSFQFTNGTVVSITEGDLSGYWKIGNAEPIAFCDYDPTSGFGQYRSYLHERPAEWGTWSLDKNGKLTIQYDIPGEKPIVIDSVKRTGNQLTLKGAVEFNGTYILVSDCNGKSVDDSTANWKTYTNSQYGFEFKYPLIVTARDISSEIVRLDVSVGDQGSIAVLVGPRNSSLIAESFSEPTGAVVYNKNEKVGDINWQKKEIVEFPKNGIGTYGDEMIYYTEKNNLVYSLTCFSCVPPPDGAGMNNDALKDLLSTFKFTK